MVPECCTVNVSSVPMMSLTLARLMTSSASPVATNSLQIPGDVPKNSQVVFPKQIVFLIGHHEEVLFGEEGLKLLK